MNPDMPAPDGSPTTPSAEVSAAAPSGLRRLEVLRAGKPLVIAGIAFAATFAGLVVFAWPSPGDKIASTVRVAPAPPLRAPTLTPPMPAPGTTIQPAPAPEHAPSHVTVEIRVRPASATLTIDDAEVIGNPFVGKFRRDTVVHHLRAAAPGYIPRSLLVGLDANVSLDVSLERVPPPVRIISTPRPYAGEGER